MPSFAGLFIFGSQVKIATGGTRREAQVNAFFGLDGVEEIDGGFREHVTTATGRHSGYKEYGGALDLFAAQATFRGLIDGFTYVLVDSFGQPWRNVKLESFDPDPEGVKQTPYEYYQFYTATFKHLSRS